jgi:hypothetical protein
MRSSRFLVLTAAFVLGTAISVVPLDVAGAQPPSTAVLVPSNGAAVYGKSVVLDASASSGVTQVQFRLTGGSLTDSVVATATITYYGWIAKWDSTTVADGTYTLQSVATEGSSSTTSTGISIIVTNGTPSVSIVLPSSGANLSGSQWLDAIASPGVTSVLFKASTGTPGACPSSGPMPEGICTIGYATPTEYGWLIDWDTTQVPNAGSGYNLLAGARYPNGNIGIAGLSPAVSVSVVNPAPTVVVPANNSTVSGSQWLDCAVPAGLSGPVQFEYLSSGFPTVIGTATASQYGWLYDWNTTSLANGTYTLFCSATYPSGTGSGASISVTVAN